MCVCVRANLIEIRQKVPLTFAGLFLATKRPFMNGAISYLHGFIAYNIKSRMPR